MAPLTEADLEQSPAVVPEVALDELERVLASPQFSISKRYPAFLRYVVEAVLSGRESELKERTIGVEVFRREPTYDTTTDPVVRVTAGEVRKRLVQYYEDPSHHRMVQIAITAGSYIPQFISLDTKQTETLPELHQEHPRTEISELQSTPGRVSWFRLSAICVLVGLLLGGIGYLSYKTHASDAPVQRLWAPFIASGNNKTILIMGAMPMTHPSPFPQSPTPEMPLLDATHRYNIVPFADATAASRMTGLLGRYRAPFRVAISDVATFDDLRSGPIVLIGGLTNQWTVRLTAKQRFRFEDSLDISRIIDRDAQKQPDWKLYRLKPYSDLVQDYAIVARFQDSTTGNPVMIAAGIGPNGTIAAGEFLTNRLLIEKLFANAPTNWKGENLEIVIATEVIDGKSGPPHIVSGQYW